MQASRDQWSSRLVFVFAATGSAVGLGNIWKFPYMAGENGGSSFILVYLAIVFLIGLPILCCELMLGRHGKRNTMNLFRRFNRDYGTSNQWSVIGWMGALTGALILSYYSVIGGWVIEYIFKAAGNMFAGVSSEVIAAQFKSFVADPMQLLLWHSVFMGIVALTLAGGVRGGIERAVRYMIPLLALLLIALIGYNIATLDMGTALNFMFDFQPEKITPAVVLAALGQAFFSIGVGMGAMMIYGSYLPEGKPLLGLTSVIVVADTSIAIFAGLAIFPVLFAFGIEPGQGAGLIFNTLPIAFGQMPGGVIFGTLFFVLLFIAAWTSAISLIEPMIAWGVENRGWGRKGATWGISLIVWLLGLLTVFSFSDLSDVKLFGKNPFELIDYVTSNILLPLGGLLIVIFAAWILPATVAREEAGIEPGRDLIWKTVTRFLCPAAILIVFYHSVF